MAIPTTSSQPSVTAVVSQLLKLSEDPKKRPFIARDKTCLSSVLRFIENSDPNIVDLALRVLVNTSLEPSVKPILYTDSALLSSIKKALASPSSTEHHKMLCAQIFKNIQPVAASPTSESSSSPGPNHLSSTTAAPSQTAAASNAPSQMHSSRYRTKSSAHPPKANHIIITLFVKGIDGHHKSHDRQTLESALIRTKGVISFTYDILKPYILLRCTNTVTPQDIYTSLTASRNCYSHPLAIQQVIKNPDDKLEQLFTLEDTTSLPPKTFDTAAGTGADDGYLDESYSDSQNGSANEQTFSGNVLARLDDDKKASSGWIGKASSFLAKSLYW